MTTTSQRLVGWLGLLLLVVVYCGALWGYPLQDPDEGRYAEIPREMIESGDWITPRLNYVVYFEKPPLLYWLVALCFELLGTNEGSARLVSAVSGIATVLLTFLAGRWMLGYRGALLAGGVLATSPLFFILGQALTIDMLLTACMTATMVFFYRAHCVANKRAWVAGVAIAAGLGVLAKGPVALVVPGMVGLSYLLWQRDWETLRALLRPLPLALFVLLVFPWFILVAWENPEFFDYFFVRQHFDRFTADVGHPEGPFFYIPFLLGGPLPWTAVAAGLACTRAGRASLAEVPALARTFLILWAVIILGFFTAASSKLATYILPALPPLALLLGGWLDRVLYREEFAAKLSRTLGTGAFTLGVCCLIIAGVAWPLQDTLAHRFSAEPRHVLAVVAGVAALGAALASSGFFVGRSGTGRRLAPGLGLAVLIAGLGLASFGAVQARAVAKTSREVSLAVRRNVSEGDLLVLYERIWQGVPFYTGQRVVMVGNYGEITHGAGLAPRRDEYFWQTPDPLVQAWNSDRRVFVFTHRRHIAELAALVGGQPRVLARDRGRVVLVNFPRPGDGGLPRAGLRIRAVGESPGRMKWRT